MATIAQMIASDGVDDATLNADGKVWEHASIANQDAYVAQKLHEELADLSRKEAEGAFADATAAVDDQLSSRAVRRRPRAAARP